MWGVETLGMLKKLLSYGFVEAFAKGLNKLTILVLPLLVSNIDGFGVIGLIISIEIILPLISLLGLERAVLRFYSKAEDQESFRNTVLATINLTHCAIFIFLILMSIMGFKSVFGINIWLELILVVLVVYLQGINTLHLNFYRVEEKHKKYFNNRSFLQFLKFTLVIIFVYISNSYIGYLIGASIAALITNFVFHSYKSMLLFRINRRVLCFLIAFSWPFIFHGIAGNLLGNVDRFVIKNYMTLEDVGIYTLAYSFASSIVFAFLGITVYLEPLIYKEENARKRRILLDKLVAFLILAGLLAFFIIAVFSEHVFPDWYSNGYKESFLLIPLLASSFLAQPYYLKANYSLIYEQKTFVIASVSIVSSLINIALNIVLIPRLGLMGAVYSTAISNLFQFITFSLVANRFKLERDFLEVTIFSFILLLYVFKYFNLNLLLICMLTFVLYKFYQIRRSYA